MYLEGNYQERKAASLESYQYRVDEMAELIKCADAVVVGIGNGLCVYGGSGYVNTRLVRKWFPQYYEMGFSKMSEIQAVYWQANEGNILSYWGYWANFIRQVRYQTPVQHEYKMLKELLYGKEYYVCTTNADGQAVRAGITKEKIFAPQGDYGLLQCSEPCCNQIYRNKNIIDEMCSSIDSNGEIDRKLVPYCPKCGAPMIPNVRFGANYIAEPHMENYKGFEKFILDNRWGNLLFLECGVEVNAPEIIRTPFEKLVENIDNSHLVRINSKNYRIPENLQFKSVVFFEEIARVFDDVLFSLNRQPYMVK